jgi:hypothetical protein
LPIGFEIVRELHVVLGVSAGEEGATGAQAVFEGIEADGGLSLGAFGTGRVLRILLVKLLAVSLKLTCWIFLFGVGGLVLITRFKNRTRVRAKGRAEEGGELVSSLIGGGCGGGIYFRDTDILI